MAATATFTITVFETGMVTVGLNTNIADNDIVNIAERAAGFPISGTVNAGAAVSVTIGSGTARVAVVTGTTWTVAIPVNAVGLGLIGTSATVTVTAMATLAGSSDMATRMLTVDLAAPTATYAAPATLTVDTAIIAISPGTPSSDISAYAVQSGTLPPGLTLDTTGGGITGTPTTATATVPTPPVTIRLTDTAGNPTDVSLTFPAVAMGSQTLAGFAYSAATATVGQPAPTVSAPTGAVAGSSLRYASGDPNICTVDAGTGVLTPVAAGACVITVTASATTNYQAATATFTVTITAMAAPTTAGVTVTPTVLTVAENDGTATYTVVLDSLPTANVVIVVASDDSNVATVAPTSLTFTTSNGTTPQTVTVTGRDDGIDNPGDARTATVTHTATSATGIIDVVVTVTDDDDPPTVAEPIANQVWRIDTLIDPPLPLPVASGTGMLTYALTGPNDMPVETAVPRADLQWQPRHPVRHADHLRHHRADLQRHRHRRHHPHRLYRPHRRADGGAHGAVESADPATGAVAADRRRPSPDCRSSAGGPRRQRAGRQPGARHRRPGSQRRIVLGADAAMAAMAVRRPPTRPHSVGDCRIWINSSYTTLLTACRLPPPASASACPASRCTPAATTAGCPTTMTGWTGTATCTAASLASTSACNTAC